ncbi:hypothetical protein [Noviherbaspirillum aerium]|uniref:hypothetical protein n=1 Tax=Noviherbaspirillum aerium TaxID=2588497 RepID=UPI00124EEC78|nr:hypothetical protein [Noviherbaspirillum aerium]
MSRRRANFLEIDTCIWPAVDYHALSPENQKVYAARCKAIELYVAGRTLRDIEEETGINSRQLYWLLDRCLKCQMNRPGF